MKYRNVITGVVIETACEISGGNWQAVVPAGTPVVAEPEPVKEEKAEENAPKEEVKKPKRTKGATIKPKKES